MATSVLPSFHRIEPLESRRLLSSYFLDPSFGQHGLAAGPITWAPNPHIAFVTEVAGGKILAVGQNAVGENPSTSHVMAARFNADGTVDTTFGTGGAAISFEIGFVVSAAIDQDGNVVVMGTIVRGGNAFVARYTPSFALDTQFGGGDGVIDFGGTGPPECMAIGADNSVVVAGTIEPHEDDQIGVVRLTPNGQLDTTFGGDGSVLIDRPNLLHVRGVALQDDARIILVGEDGPSSMVMRLTTTGALDSTFATAGVGHYPTLGNVVIPAVQADGLILIGSDSHVGRLTPAGALDTSFSGDGVADFAGNVEWSVLQFRIDPATGKIAALTQSGIMKYLSNGQLDPTFVEDGTIPWIADPDTGVHNGLLGLAQEDGAFGVITDASQLTISKYVPRVTDLDDQGHILISGTAGDDTITLEADGNQARLTRNGDVTTYPLAEVFSVEVQSGDGENTISILLDVPTTVATGSGDDSITVGNGPASIAGGDGDNFVSIGAGGTITTGSGNDTILASGGDHQITSGAGNDSITTGDGVDAISAGAGDDVISSGGGADTIHADSGADSVSAGDGNDRVFGEDGDDSIDGGHGNDYLLGGSHQTAIFNVVEDDGQNTILGGEGNDSLIGGVVADSILGGDGNDMIGAGHGANTVFGGAGSDCICGGDGNDWFWGESGYDTMKGGYGDDYLHGGNGKDRLFGQQGDDRLYGSGNDDALDGGPGIDLMMGGDGNDKLWADDGEADTVDGGAGIDQGRADLIDQLMSVEDLLA